MDFLFVGTCRGGTAYVCEVLKSLGLNAGHERVFNRRGEKWIRKVWERYDADVSWLAVPYLDLAEGLEIVRVVRHPMDTINSILRLNLPAQAGFWNYVDSVTEHWSMWESPEDRVAQFYLDWHEMISEKAWWSVNVEDGPEPIAYAVGKWSDDLFDDRACNHRNGSGREVGFEELAEPLRGQLLSFCDAHGYEL